MRVGVVGGIFSKPVQYRDVITSTPETILVDGLLARGHQVDALSQEVVHDLRRYDIVHVHHLSIGALRAACTFAPARFVFTPHGWTPSGRPRRAAERFVLRRADAVVALSNTEADRLMRLRAQRDATVHVISNGIPLKNFPFSQPAPPEAEPWCLLYVGQLLATKGVDILLRALPALTSRFRVVLRLAYQVPTEESRLKDMAKDLGVSDSVEFLGMQSSGALSSQYSRAHVVVLPSYSEALPSVVTEAMLSGRPVVATDVGGVREQMGDFGVVVAPGSVETLTNGVALVIDYYTEHAHRAAEMRAWAETQYSVDAMIEAHEHLYAGLIADHTILRRKRLSQLGGTMMMGGAARAWTTLRAS